jgi:hypothetical protein
VKHISDLDVEIKSSTRTARGKQVALLKKAEKEEPLIHGQYSPFLRRVIHAILTSSKVAAKTRKENLRLAKPTKACGL